MNCGFKWIFFSHSTINQTPLDIAVVHNSLKVCIFIVENNLDQIPCGKIWSRYSILHTAAFKGHTAIYKLIMEKIADKNPVIHGFA